MGKRRYDDGCGVAHALDLVGERWALLIVRDLLLGPKRFTDLQAGLPGAGPNVLSQRLRDLQHIGVVRRRTLPPPAGSQVYELTDWGAELEPIVTAMGFWGARSPVVPRTGEVRADSTMLLLRSHFRPQPARTWTASYEFRLGRDIFAVRVVDGRLAELSRGQAYDRPDAVVETDSMTLGALLGGQQRVAAAVTTGKLRLTGDPASVRRLFDACTAAVRPAATTAPGTGTG
ncbi:transcriptional regulator [Micromonospora sp. NBC_01699]|uniref:winged helix-turn-helix transcriptional regulator n=1 Tax=Micromonospora sp. NBC_01699 TaxID=2975984 RepID=UPI002E315722|nr:winged helix-turn-helix transcriptional regulator [Micromonospora sp. NBC_01699]